MPTTSGMPEGYMQQKTAGKKQRGEWFGLHSPLARVGSHAPTNAAPGVP